MILSNRYHYPPEFYEKSLQALQSALHTARLYRSWRKLDPGLEATLEQRYDAMPELTKEAIRKYFPDGLVSNGLDVEDGLAREEIDFSFTSGTTSEKVVNLWNQRWWDASEKAAWKLNANTARLRYPQKEAKLASALNVGIHSEDDLPMENRLLGHRLYLNEKLSLISWQPRHMRRMAQELNAFEPVVLEANPSLLAYLAFWAMDEGVQLYSPAVIVFTYEFPSRIHLDAISKVFTSPFVSSYGSTETGFVLQQCEKGLFHQNADFCRIDFHPLKEKYGGPELGRTLVTTFGNPWSAIIQFDTGDLIRLHPSGRCACGRETGMIAQAIEGRVANCTFATDGSLVTTMVLDNALARIPHIRDYQLVQRNRTEYDLQLVAATDAARVQDAAHSALESVYGKGASFSICILPRILPGPSGKFRRTRIRFPFDWKELFQ